MRCTISVENENIDNKIVYELENMRMANEMGKGRVRWECGSWMKGNAKIGNEKTLKMRWDSVNQFCSVNWHWSVYGSMVVFESLESILSWNLCHPPQIQPYKHTSMPQATHTHIHLEWTIFPSIWRILFYRWDNVFIHPLPIVSVICFCVEKKWRPIKLAHWYCVREPDSFCMWCGFVVSPSHFVVPGWKWTWKWSIDSR